MVFGIIFFILEGSSMMRTFLFITLISLSQVFHIEAVVTPNWEKIDTITLEKIMESGTPMVLLDARGDQWNDKNIMPGAKLAGSDFSAERLAALIPEKGSLIIVYGFSSSCPKGPNLVRRLMSLGYYKVIEYPAGLKAWRESGYPVDEIRL